MPTLGDVAKAKEIGKKSGRFLFAICPDCKTERWVQIGMTTTMSGNIRCAACRIESQKNGLMKRFNSKLVGKRD